MKRLLRLAARFYPATWRQRYGVEFEALLDETTPRWRDVADVLIGGFQMHVRRARPLLMAALFGIAGAAAAGTLAVRAPDRFASAGTMSVQPGLQPHGSDTAALEDVMARLGRAAFRGDTLVRIIERRDLYRRERTESPAETVVNRMREDIGVEIVSPRVVRVSFISADAGQTPQVTRDLLTELVEANLHERSGSVVRLIDLPGEPRPFASPRRVAFASATGLGGGVLIGALVALVRRRYVGLS